MTTPIEPVIESVTATPDVTSAQQQQDRFGNTILDAPGPLGQYRIQSAREWDKGRILRVCGEADTTKHLVWWEYDKGERRMVCSLCWRWSLRSENEQESDEQVDQEHEDV